VAAILKTAAGLKSGWAIILAENNEAWHTEVAASYNTPKASTLLVTPRADLFEEASTLEGGTIDDVDTISSKVDDSSNQACRLPSSHCGSRLRLAPHGASLSATVWLQVCANASNVISTTESIIPLNMKSPNSSSSGINPPPAWKLGVAWALAPKVVTRMDEDENEDGGLSSVHDLDEL
jgi:hypothetical protein